ncbi:MAG: hypothetical protein CMJ81_16280 [Planctomycetaceae bacterium]|nr:hypothetical protein [Planctomycetaceae bacterium]
MERSGGTRGFGGTDTREQQVVFFEPSRLAFGGLFNSPVDSWEHRGGEQPFSLGTGIQRRHVRVETRGDLNDMEALFPVVCGSVSKPAAIPTLARSHPSRVCARQQRAPAARLARYGGDSQRATSVSQPLSHHVKEEPSAEFTQQRLTKRVS